MFRHSQKLESKVLKVKLQQNVQNDHGRGASS